MTYKYKLHMGGVITGSLNCFCLACDDFLKSPQDATDHIGTAEHQKKANAVQFSDKFKDENIKKFKWGYYCEFCNVLMPTASKVNFHVTEDEHKHNKGLLLLKPTGLDVVAFNNVLIEEKAWHGLIEGVCSLCNVEFEDEDDHKGDPRHSLNLVLKPIQFRADNAIFRPLDDTAVQCLTCNKLLAPGRLSQHLDDTEHHELYAKRRIETDGVCRGSEAQENYQDKATNKTSVIENNDEINKLKVDNDSIEKKKTEDKNNNLKSLTKDKPPNLDQNVNRVDINDKTTLSSDDKHNVEVVNDSYKGLRECGCQLYQNDSTNERDNDTNSICSVNDFDNTPSENFEKGSQEEEARDFANANQITYNGDNKQSFCSICDVHVPATFRTMKEHAEGAKHKRLVASSKSSTKQPKTPGKLSKQKTIEFIDSNWQIGGPPFRTASMINEKYFILQSSCDLVSESNSRMRCFVCDINLPSYSDHVKTSQHQDRWKKVPVITSETNEFIREVRPGLYHCGYCHLVVSGWTEMKQHLDCSDHRNNRTNWEGRMRQHLPRVQQLGSLPMLRIMKCLIDD